MLPAKINLFLASCCLTLCAVNAYAVAPGLYLGAMLGDAVNMADTETAQIIGPPLLTTSVKPNKSQFGGRIYLGYDINDYFGIEGGYTYFSPVNYHSTTGDDDDIFPCGGAAARVSTIDLVAKGILPIYSFSLYAKAGADAAFINTSSSLNNLLADPDDIVVCGKSVSTTNVRPTFSLGASYDLSQNWVADVSYNRVMVGSPIDAFNFYALGISYHFVDKYCGQFLCDD